MSKYVDGSQVGPFPSIVCDGHLAICFPTFRLWCQSGQADGGMWVDGTGGTWTLQWWSSSSWSSSFKSTCWKFSVRRWCSSRVAGKSLLYWVSCTYSRIPFRHLLIMSFKKHLCDKMFVKLSELDFAGESGHLGSRLYPNCTLAESTLFPTTWRCLLDPKG